MKSRRFGALPIEVSTIGLGTAQLANTDGLFKGTKYVSADAARRVVRAAIEQGVTFFDTADRYGGSELILGGLDRGTKARLTIATKAGLREDGTRDFSHDYLRQQIDRSLQRLRVETLDVFQLNKPSLHDLHDGGLVTLLDELKRSGKIRYAGVVVGSPEVGDAWAASGFVDCLQVFYNLLFRQAEALIRLAASRGIGIIVRSPLNSGLLAGQYMRGTAYPSDDDRSRFFSGIVFEARLRRMEAICEGLGIVREELLEYALRYLLSNDNVSTIIPGASSVSQVLRYVACGRQGRFNESELARIREVLARCDREYGCAADTGQI